MSTYLAGVPSAAERKGDFGEICGANGGTFDANGLCNVITGQLYDPPILYCVFRACAIIRYAGTNQRTLVKQT